MDQLAQHSARRVSVRSARPVRAAVEIGCRTAGSALRLVEYARAWTSTALDGRKVRPNNWGMNASQVDLHTGMVRHHSPARGDALDLLGIAPAAARILRFFLVRPGAQPHARELQRVLELGGGSLQRELERLVALGALERLPQGRRVHYRAVSSSPVWKAIALLESASADPTPLIRDAVVDVPGIQAAFVFGSTARGTAREDSDIDLMIIEGDTLDRRKLLEQLNEVALVVGREVNPVRYTMESLGERLANREHPAQRFVRDALAGPKDWVAGSPSMLRSVAAAARISPDALAGARA